MLIDQLPQIVREAAGGLANANINVLNGADGLGQIAAGLVGQGLTIFDSVKANLIGNGDGDGDGPARNPALAGGGVGAGDAAGDASGDAAGGEPEPVGDNPHQVG